MNFEQGNEMWLNIKKNCLPKGLNHDFLGPYVGSFKVLEKRFPNIFKLELPKNLKVHPIFHVLFFKPVTRDASKLNQEYNSKPPPNFIDNELEFEMEAMLKSRQLKRQEREYLVKWKGYHPIKTPWVNESYVEHA